MITVGMDAHVRNSYLHVTDDAGNVMRRGRCRNTMMDLAKFLGPIEREAVQRGEPVSAVLESTTNSRAIQRMLMEYGRAAGIDLTGEVLNARKIRIIAESVCKCDRLDAKVLSELARSNLKLPVCYMPDDDEFALREHLRARSDLVRMRTMLKNRVHAVLHRRGILAPTADMFTRIGRAFLAQLDLDEAGRTILDRYLETMDQIHRAIDGLLERADASPALGQTGGTLANHAGDRTDHRPDHPRGAGRPEALSQPRGGGQLRGARSDRP